VTAERGTIASVSASRYNFTMCARFTLRSPADLLVVRFGLSAAPDLRPRYNIAPS